MTSTSTNILKTQYANVNEFRFSWTSSRCKSTKIDKFQFSMTDPMGNVSSSFANLIHFYRIDDTLTGSVIKCQLMKLHPFLSNDVDILRTYGNEFHIHLSTLQLSSCLT